MIHRALTSLFCPSVDPEFVVLSEDELLRELHGLVLLTNMPIKTLRDRPSNADRRATITGSVAADSIGCTTTHGQSSPATAH